MRISINSVITYFILLSCYCNCLLRVRADMPKLCSLQAIIIMLIHLYYKLLIINNNYKITFSVLSSCGALLQCVLQYFHF